MAGYVRPGEALNPGSILSNLGTQLDERTPFKDISFDGAIAPVPLKSVRSVPKESLIIWGEQHPAVAWM